MHASAEYVAPSESRCDLGPPTPIAFARSRKLSCDVGEALTTAKMLATRRAVSRSFSTSRAVVSVAAAFLRVCITGR